MTGSIGCLCQELPEFPVTDDLPTPNGNGSLDGSSDAALPSPLPGDRSPPSWNPVADADSPVSFEEPPAPIEADLPDPKRELSYGDKSPLSIDVDSEAEARKEAEDFDAKALKGGEDSEAEAFKEGEALGRAKVPSSRGRVLGPRASQ